MSLNTIGSDTVAIFAGKEEDCWYVTPFSITPVGCEFHVSKGTTSTFSMTSDSFIEAFMVNIFPGSTA